MLAVTRAARTNVAVLGACGGIGQPLAMLLKLDANVKRLALYDVVNPAGVAEDLSHICTPAKVTSATGDRLGDALRGADVVVIPAGVPRKPGMTRDDLFKINAGIVATLAKGVAENCPNAKVCVISNPVNSLVPLFAEVLKARGVYDKRRLFGVTTLDGVRAKTFMGDLLSQDPEATQVDVIGGHAGTTIVPVLGPLWSRVPGGADRAAMTYDIQFAGDKVVKAKDGAGSATLSMAYSGARFASRLVAAMAGEKNVIECSFVESDVVKGAQYFTSPVRLGPNGAEEVFGIDNIGMDATDKKNADDMLGDLLGQIEKGAAFGKSA